MAVHPYLDNDGPIAIAHRGGAKETVENSFEAFTYAVGLGYRYVETDCHLTADGVVIAFHDPALDRVTNEVGKVNSRTWAELQQVQLNGGGRITTIDELITEFPSTRFNIDVKSNEVRAPLLRVLDRRDAFDRVCIGSFSDARLAKVRKERPGSVCTSFGPRGVLRWVAASRGIPIEPPQGDALQVSPTFRGAPLLNKVLVDYAHKCGLYVHAWTIDDEAEMHRLLDLGVDGIMTDRPSLLSQVFAERGLDL